MKTASMVVLALTAAVTAHADFSYSTARKGGQGPMANAGPQSNKQFLKGQKMKTDTGDTTVILDFDAQTVTMLNNAQKTYTVTSFTDAGNAVPEGVGAKIDLKETGQKKSINGFNATQAILTMEMEGAGGPPGMKMQMEMELWVSPDVPGAQEVKAFYAKNVARFPWGAMVGGGNPAMRDSMAGIQKKMASLGGIAVLQIIRMKPAGNSAQMAQAQAGASQAMAQLEAMRKQGGPQAAAAEAAIARMGGASGGGGGALFEITMESTGFSTGAIADSVFAVPAGYQKK